MKLKIAGIIMGAAILILGVAIYNLQTKEEPAPVVIVKPAPEPVKPPVVVDPPKKPDPPVIVQPPQPVHPKLEVREAWILKTCPVCPK